MPFAIQAKILLNKFTQFFKNHQLYFMPAFSDIKDLLAQAYQAFTDFMKQLTEIKKEEQTIVKEMYAKEDQKKIDVIKSKIDHL